MKEILNKIALNGTDNRRYAIIDFLEQNNIKYEIEEVEKTTTDFSHPFFKEKDTQLTMLTAMYVTQIQEAIDMGCEIPDGMEEKILDDDFLYSELPDVENLDAPADAYNIEYLYNIIIKFNNDYDISTDKMLFTAHYDVVLGSKGANDNASSITILLTLAKYINDNKINSPIRMVFFDGEERGGIGSSNYADKHFTSKEQKAEVTMINLDVCGCGSNIVIVDNILNDNSKVINLLTKDNRLHYDIVEVDSFPFSDASIFKNKDIGALSISVFPQEDIDLLQSKEDAENVEPEKTVIRKHFGSYIWQYMHNGKYDDISFINYDIMNQTYEYIKNLV